MPEFRNWKKKFNPDVFEYDLEVGQSMEMFICSIIPMEEDSVVTAPENLMLAMGQNRFEILVTAPAGNTQTYVFNIHRLDHELEPESETESESESETETESVQESETDLQSESLTEGETLTETEVETESETLGEELLSEAEAYSETAPETYVGE